MAIRTLRPSQMEARPRYAPISRDDLPMAWPFAPPAASPRRRRRAGTATRCVASPAPSVAAPQVVEILLPMDHVVATAGDDHSSGWTVPLMWSTPVPTMVAATPLLLSGTQLADGTIEAVPVVAPPG